MSELARKWLSADTVYIFVCLCSVGHHNHFVAYSISVSTFINLYSNSVSKICKDYPRIRRKPEMGNFWNSIKITDVHWSPDKIFALSYFPSVSSWLEVEWTFCICNNNSIAFKLLSLTICANANSKLLLKMSIHVLKIVSFEKEICMTCIECAVSSEKCKFKWIYWLECKIPLTIVSFALFCASMQNAWEISWQL